jgi:hypothetical protein
VAIALPIPAQPGNTKTAVTTWPKVTRLGVVILRLPTMVNTNLLTRFPFFKILGFATTLREGDE